MDVDEHNLFDYDENKFDLEADIEEPSSQGLTLVSKNPTSLHYTGQTSLTEVVYVSGGHMKCPVLGCNAGRFVTKGKFTRHWSQTHTRFSLRYVCGLGSCHSTCRRRYDMKMHIRDVHHVSDMRRVNELVSRCSQSMSRNRGFLPPGSLVYRRKTSRDSTPTPVTSSLIAFPASIPFTRMATFSAPSDETSRASSATSSGTTIVPAYSATAVVSSLSVRTKGSQTSCLEFPPLILPPVPENREELQAYIRWCSLSMDQIGRQREAAKKTLTEMGSRLDEEKRQRRKLEIEVRRLQSEINNMKQKEAYGKTAFPSLTQDLDASKH